MAAPVTPASFLSETPPDRIIGSECEYNLQAGERGGAVLDLGAYMTDKALAGIPLKRVYQYLGNGSRLYVDVGHIEYAGPECLGPKQAAAADLAGITVMQRMVHASDLPHRGLYRLAGTYLSKANAGFTSGYHENYLLSRRLSYDSMISDLIPSHLASRLWAMGGTIRNGNFVFSQKVGGIGGAPIARDFSRRTTPGNKPMALIPSEHTDADTVGNSQWARLEVRFAVPLLSPLARYVSFAASRSSWSSQGFLQRFVIN